MRMRGLLTCLLILVAAAPAHPKAKTYQTGKILSIRSPEANAVSYRMPTRAPAQDTVFTHDISVQVGDSVVVGRYKSWTDYLPSTWTEGSSVAVRLGKHSMYLKGPVGDEFKLRIVSRRSLHEGK